MATYKVLQDIEAEDKLFGPLTLKQFIFAGITIALGYFSFVILASGAPIFIKVILISVLLPPILVFGFLAAPIGRDQPNDIWMLARLRFLFKPRTRIWNQDGISDLVTITAPKKEIAIQTKDFTQDEVKSRLKALANTVDSRGWAVKNVNTNLFAQPGYLTNTTSSDRLIDPANLPQEVSNIEILASDDMLDTANNSKAQQLNQLMQQSTAQHKQQVIAHMSGQQAAQPPQNTSQDYWFLNQPAAPDAPLPQDYATFASQQVVAPGAEDARPAATATADEEALVHKVVEESQRAREHGLDHIKVLQPLHDRDGNLIPQPAPDPVTPPAQSTLTTQSQPATRQDPVDPAILGLAQNDDLNIATIARQAEKISKPNDDGEVVISLH